MYDIRLLNIGREHQCSRIRIFRFFQISKKHDFVIVRFFEMMFQKNVKVTKSIKFGYYGYL